jgi:hypothetical protein
VTLYKGNETVGSVAFVQEQRDGHVKVTGKLNGLTLGPHGFHIHEKGDVSVGCNNVGDHFNPENVSNFSSLTNTCDCRLGQREREKESEGADQLALRYRTLLYYVIVHYRTTLLYVTVQRYCTALRYSTMYAEINQPNALKLYISLFFLTMAPTCFGKTMPSSRSDYFPV